MFLLDIYIVGGSTGFGFVGPIAAATLMGNFTCF